VATHELINVTLKTKFKTIYDKTNMIRLIQLLN